MSSAASSVEHRRLTTGFNHVAVITRDLDRAVAFWCSTLGAEFQDISDHHGRHGFIVLAPGSAALLHLFEVSEEDTGPIANAPMMRRGRIDHLAIGAKDEPALVEICDRLVARGASSGSVQRFGDDWLSVHAVDPDGMEFEIVCTRTGDTLHDDNLTAAH